MPESKESGFFLFLLYNNTQEVVMTICVFPGTFNPIHNGHIKMAEFALKKYKFNKIINIIINAKTGSYYNRICFIK